MNAAQRNRIGYSTLILLGLVFVAAVMASNTLLRGLRIDLTQNKIYTLSAGTKKVLHDIDEPVNLYFFYSDKEAKNAYLRAYATRVHEMLDEFAANSDGKLKVKVIDPEPFSDDEDRATQLGLQAVNLGGAEDQKVFFGVAGTNSVGDTQKIPFLQPDKEAFLEYDLAHLVYGLAHPKKPVVALLSGVPMAGGYDARSQRVTMPWTIMTEVRQLFDVRTLPKSVSKIDPDVDVLWIVHPKDLDDKTLYAIDQFVLRGGRALVFVDPLAEIASPGPQAGIAGIGAASSDLKRLFDAWGVQYSPAQVVGDNLHALRVNTGNGQAVRHIGLIGLDDKSMDQKDVITSGLESINLGTAGALEKAKGAKVKFTPLILSSTQSALVPAIKMQFLDDPGRLLDDFTPTGKQYTLAARLSGHIETAFPDGPPAEKTPDADAGKQDAASADDKSAGKDAGGKESSAAAAKEGGKAAAAKPASLKSTDDANIVIVADVDMLSDRMWVQRQNFLGQALVSAFANNGDFVTNALDNLSGSAELIGLKSRPTFSRPFTTVVALRAAADRQFRATQQRLQAELKQTQQKLGELQASRTDKTSLIMTPDQEKEVQQFRAQELQIRKQLRDVQHNLDQSIERLGTRLKVINIGLVPLALTLFALLVVYLRRRRHGA